MRLSAPIFKLKREAKRLARERAIPLHEALDRVAAEEGFRSWSHLAASASASGARPAARILAALRPGEVVLIGARPGQGKTLL
ncbi:MAG: DNA helicase, partial [Pseudomonadota bacterium]